MSKENLFKKYAINESHSTWDNRQDNWSSVEIYRLMHNGELQADGDESVSWITEFFDKCRDDIKFMQELMKRSDWGSLYLTAKRMIYRFSEEILNEQSVLKK